MTTFAANLLTALISATLGALIAYLLAFRRFREEKWWERKAEAYARTWPSQKASVVRILTLFRPSRKTDAATEGHRRISSRFSSAIARVVQSSNQHHGNARAHHTFSIGREKGQAPSIYMDRGFSVAGS